MFISSHGDDWLDFVDISGSLHSFSAGSTGSEKDLFYSVYLDIALIASKIPLVAILAI